MINASANSHVILTLTVISSLVVSSPLLALRPPWFGFWIIAMVIPYALVLTRSLRDPRDRSGHALAIGISVVMTMMGVLLILVQWERHEVLPFVFAGSLAAVHLLLGYFALQHYRHGASSKPHWRLLLRGFLDPLAYYAILFVIASGVHLHLR